MASLTFGVAKLFHAFRRAGRVEILVQLVQIGGIGGTLAFLLLGYNLLVNEQGLKDAQGNPSTPRPQVFDAIYRFLRYALVFFAVGIAAQVGITLMQDRLQRWNQLDVVQLIFDRWFYDPANNRTIVSFSEVAFSDAPVVEKAKRQNYDVYVGMRARQATRPLAGEYPVLLGPFDFGPAANQERAVTAEQITQLGGCVQFVLLGVAKNGAPLSEPFKPANLSTPPVVFNTVSSCP